MDGERSKDNTHPPVTPQEQELTEDMARRGALERIISGGIGSLIDEKWDTVMLMLFV